MKAIMQLSTLCYEKMLHKAAQGKSCNAWVNNCL